ncbi:uncharacterized protein LOC129300786 [Prosopis cineraria]|uniref:uncharacterized protein LOC129300786 n=1 Tax=Prosopis cineraria TaxID=364024 RepID=UPI00240F90BD|nr:uncharacterized protein LOC129300786 [Prosopis cineraria]
MRSNSAQNGPANLAYGMYPLPAMNPGGVSSNGPTIPSVVMLYPYDHNASYSSPEQLEFGSLGSMGFSGVNELSQLNEGSRSGREHMRNKGFIVVLLNDHQINPLHPASQGDLLGVIISLGGFSTSCMYQDR